MRTRPHMILLLVCAGAVLSGAWAQPPGALPFDTRWEYPHFLTFRPGNGQECDVNPPRFSWPYVPHVLTDAENVRRHDFVFQLSSTGDFVSPEIEVKTPYNFYNAFEPLAPGMWHWRVGYWVGSAREQWSAVRTFTATEDTPKWDRSPITRAVETLSAMPHPRMAPAGGDWAGFREQIENSKRLSPWLHEALAQADAVVEGKWWSNFPQSDVPEETRYKGNDFVEMSRGIALAAFLYRLTGREEFARSKDLALQMAAFPRGGLASPEYHGGDNKRTTQNTEFLALAYDWWHENLTPPERMKLLHAIGWRLEATYLEKASWAAGPYMDFRGVSLLSGSHAYENFMWCIPPVLLTAGDLPVADELAPLCLHYLTGVTAAHGPEEGWNEGYSYGTHKGGTMLGATMATGLLLPELHVGKNPLYERLGDWYAHLTPLGISRVPFGNYGDEIESKRPRQRENFRYLAWLTGEGRFAHYEDVLDREGVTTPSKRPWLDLLGATALSPPEPSEPEGEFMLFPEAGWVMANPHPLFSREAFKSATGMIFQSRPRGGYSHSFRAENDYVWYAHGATLSAGGGSTIFRDPHAYGCISHNAILINGEGQEWDHKDPAYPFAGRLLAYHEGDGYTHWVGDATHAYQTIPGLLRCHRHVVFVDESWFVVFDDIAMRPDAEPARFSWLYQIKPAVPVEIGDGAGVFRYAVDDVSAAVHLAYPDAAVDLLDVQGRDTYVNQITGEDLFDDATAGIEKKGAREMAEKHWMGHTLWLTNQAPKRDWTVMAVLTAAPEGARLPEVALLSERAVKVTLPDSAERTVSFAPDVPADIMVNLEATRAHVLATDPGVLPPSGLTEKVDLDGDAYKVQWLAQERFDRSDWVSRWICEGSSEVKLADGKLWVRRTVPGSKNTASIWFRPEVPQDVIVRFRAKAVPPADENAANKNLFLHARELDGRPLRFGRSGSYKEYHEIPNYIVTFTGGYREGWSRVRRDPGFNLLHEAGIRSEVGQESAIAVTFVEGRLRYYVDGKKVHDVVDRDPLPSGRFGLRAWSTIGWWDDIEIGRVVD